MPKKFIISIDLGGTNLKMALLDLNCNIKHKQVLSTKGASSNREKLAQAIIDGIDKILVTYGIKKRDILGVGLGLPGPIDVRKGIVHFFPNIPGWKDVPFRRILRLRLGLPVFLDNDANLMSLAEYKLGGARGFKNALCITLGTGVGGGLIIEGKLYRGANFAAGEVGHMPINENGPGCNCGGRGCLEAYIGNNKILDTAKKLFKRNISLEEVSRLAKKKNRKAITIWYGVAGHLGIALSGAVNLFNPDVIIIGGGVSGAGSILLDKVRKVILERAMPVQARGVRVFKAKLGLDAGLIGAAILVKEGMKQ